MAATHHTALTTLPDRHKWQDVSANRIAWWARVAEWYQLTGWSDVHMRQHGCRTPKTAIIAWQVVHGGQVVCVDGGRWVQPGVGASGVGKTCSGRLFVWTEDGGCNSIAAALQRQQLPALTGLADEHSRQPGCRTPKTTITYADRPGGRAHAAAWRRTPKTAITYADRPGGRALAAAWRRTPTGLADEHTRQHGAALQRRQSLR